MPLLREWMMFPRHYLERFLYSTHLFIFTNVYFDYRSGRVSFRLYFINYSQVAHNGSRFLFLFFYPKHFFAVLSRLYCSLYLIYFLTYMFFVIFRIFPWLFFGQGWINFPFCCYFTYFSLRIFFCYICFFRIFIVSHLISCMIPNLFHTYWFLIHLRKKKQLYLSYAYTSTCAKR